MICAWISDKHHTSPFRYIVYPREYDFRRGSIIVCYCVCFHIRTVEVQAVLATECPYAGSTDSNFLVAKFKVASTETVPVRSALIATRTTCRNIKRGAVTTIECIFCYLDWHITSNIHLLYLIITVL